MPKSATPTRKVAPPRYEEWLDYFFGRFERDCDVPGDMDWEFRRSATEISATEIADLFIYTMEHCGSDLIKFGDYPVDKPNFRAYIPLR